MQTYQVIMNGWAENEAYTIEAETEADAIAEAYRLAEAPWASLVEIEAQ